MGSNRNGGELISGAVQVLVRHLFRGVLLDGGIFNLGFRTGAHRIGRSEFRVVNRTLLTNALGTCERIHSCYVVLFVLPEPTSRKERAESESYLRQQEVTDYRKIESATSRLSQLGRYGGISDLVGMSS